MIQSKSKDRLLASPNAKTRRMASTTSVLIVDDVAQWRSQVCKLLENQLGWKVVAEACDGVQAIQMTAELSPDLVLLDIGMPVLSGLEAAKQIQQISPKSKIVFLTQERDADVRSAALDTGAHGYVLKANAGSELLPTLTAVLRNGHQADHVGAPVRGLSRR